MKPNVGTTDKLIRFLIAIVLVALFLFDVLTGTWGIVAIVVASALTLSNILGYCFFYTLIGVNTCKARKE